MKVASADAMRQLGRRLGRLLRAGDLVLLTGGLGAGKTTLAQGIGAGIGVPGPVLSPTFVIARVHRGGRLPLVHVDAYRLGSVEELDDLDLDASLADAVTLVEWGAGMAERLASDRLEVRIDVPTEGTDAAEGVDPADGADGTREVTFLPHGERWAGVRLPARS